MNLLLTTYPAQRSRNVGDRLITDSALDLIKARHPLYAPDVLFRETDLDNLTDKRIDSIVAPGFSVSDGVYRGTFRLFSDLSRMKNFFPIGCSFQQPLQPGASFSDFRYGSQTADFLSLLAERFGPYPCRDALIVKVLTNNNIPAVYCGDLSLYEERALNRHFVPPDPVQSAVFTVGHLPNYTIQSIDVLNLMRDLLPKADLFVSFHSKPSEHSIKIAEHAVELGFSELRPYGSSKNLQKLYASIDVHLGYRLHGHLFFLRSRKPSILLAEDVRSYGFSQTSDISTGCFLAFSPETLEADRDTPHRAIEFLQQEISNRFFSYRACLSNIERTYHEIIVPYFNNLARNLSVLDVELSL
ncbi:MAG: polysaccharide pyruvyl transferase family protein [Methylibium sp.]|uniref:polysaccharide pyruvyl transferase family protein n=1 Tax=Methylibium sp. TaxID=2067992 RepID=UPI00182CE33B|nr:polysaccharide pyruvyl transferase family protein [Methylibium sp.]MBA3596118.1 polysaccharide pyruvyl transferase family protein [Methylibium sp.]